MQGGSADDSVGTGKRKVGLWADRDEKKVTSGEPCH